MNGKLAGLSGRPICRGHPLVFDEVSPGVLLCDNELSHFNEKLCNPWAYDGPRQLSSGNASVINIILYIYAFS